MTACVVTVLLMPMNAPDTITAAISTVRLVVYSAMTSTSIANRVRFRYSALATPRRRSSRGATKMANTATSTPQQVNT